MTAVRMDRKETDHAVGVVEMVVWSVLIVSGLGVVIWTLAQIMGHALSG